MNTHTRVLPVPMLAVLLLSLSGCIDIITRLPPEDTSVQAVLQAEDCVPIIFGLGFGTISMEDALAGEVSEVGDYVMLAEKRIGRIRRVELHEWQFLYFGARCIRVIGE